ncbi:uncharacterized protein TNCV_3659601 [Trichonephila clavipes]|nr:uncharacterized protein TNCV_3659601 [Trichonephila clavipes]
MRAEVATAPYLSSAFTVVMGNSIWNRLDCGTVIGPYSDSILMTSEEVSEDVQDISFDEQDLRNEKDLQDNTDQIRPWCIFDMQCRRRISSSFTSQCPIATVYMKTRTTRGLLATDHVILNHGQVTWTTPELAPPLLTTTPHQREDVSALDRFSVHRCPTRRVFSGTGLELVTWQATIRYLYHLAIAATAYHERISLLKMDKMRDWKSIVLPFNFAIIASLDVKRLSGASLLALEKSVKIIDYLDETPMRQ